MTKSAGKSDSRGPMISLVDRSLRITGIEVVAFPRTGRNLTVYGAFSVEETDDGGIRCSLVLHVLYVPVFSRNPSVIQSGRFGRPSGKPATLVAEPR
jgi:hypothetical protein